MNREMFVYEYNDEMIGKDPRRISKDTYIKYGVPLSELLDAVRDRCIDCKDTELAIRKCSNIKCSSWPYRLGINPFEPPRKPYKKPDPTFRQSLSQFCIQCGTSYMAKRSDQKYCSDACKKLHQYYVRMSK